MSQVMLSGRRVWWNITRDASIKSIREARLYVSERFSAHKGTALLQATERSLECGDEWIAQHHVSCILSVLLRSRKPMTALKGRWCIIMNEKMSTNSDRCHAAMRREGRIESPCKTIVEANRPRIISALADR
nr:hypothetical protein CFP56_79580 [Quercus suber]